MAHNSTLIFLLTTLVFAACGKQGVISSTAQKTDSSPLAVEAKSPMIVITDESNHVDSASNVAPIKGSGDTIAKLPENLGANSSGQKPSNNPTLANQPLSKVATSGGVRPCIINGVTYQSGQSMGRWYALNPCRSDTLTCIDGHEMSSTITTYSYDKYMGDLSLVACNASANSNTASSSVVVNTVAKTDDGSCSWNGVVAKSGEALAGVWYASGYCIPSVMSCKSGHVFGEDGLDYSSRSGIFSTTKCVASNSLPPSPTTGSTSGNTAATSLSEGATLNAEPVALPPGTSQGGCSKGFFECRTGGSIACVNAIQNKDCSSFSVSSPVSSPPSNPSSSPLVGMAQSPSITLPQTNPQPQVQPQNQPSTSMIVQPQPSLNGAQNLMACDGTCSGSSCSPTTSAPSFVQVTLSNCPIQANQPLVINWSASAVSYCDLYVNGQIQTNWQHLSIRDASGNLNQGRTGSVPLTLQPNATVEVRCLGTNGNSLSRTVRNIVNTGVPFAPYVAPQPQSFTGYPCPSDPTRICFSNSTTQNTGFACANDPTRICFSTTTNNNSGFPCPNDPSRTCFSTTTNNNSGFPCPNDPTRTCFSNGPSTTNSGHTCPNDPTRICFN